MILQILTLLLVLYEYSISYVIFSSNSHTKKVFKLPSSCISSDHFDNIKNIRDISSANPTSIQIGKLFRCACISKATENDAMKMRDILRITSLIDLRSPSELSEDIDLNNYIYEGFKNLYYHKKKRIFVEKQVSTYENIYLHDKRNRYFISLLDESIIKKGVYKRLNFGVKLIATVLLVLSTISRRAGKKVREIFIKKINKGGLKLLNEILVDYSGREICEVLKIIADSNNHPTAVYCTAGKDRTGIIAMLVLQILGIKKEDIINDYIKSDAVYSDINDNKAMVASLKQSDVDPEVFLGAKPDVIDHTMKYIEKKYKSIEGYLNKFGFDISWRNKLKDSLIANYS